MNEKEFIEKLIDIRELCKDEVLIIDKAQFEKFNKSIRKEK